MLMIEALTMSLKQNGEILWLHPVEFFDTSKVFTKSCTTSRRKLITSGHWFVGISDKVAMNFAPACHTASQKYPHFHWMSD